MFTFICFLGMVALRCWHPEIPKPRKIKDDDKQLILEIVREVVITGGICILIGITLLFFVVGLAGELS